LLLQRGGLLLGGGPELRRARLDVLADLAGLGRRPLPRHDELGLRRVGRPAGLLGLGGLAVLADLLPVPVDDRHDRHHDREHQDLAHAALLRGRRGARRAGRALVVSHGITSWRSLVETPLPVLLAEIRLVLSAHGYFPFASSSVCSNFLLISCTISL